MGKAWENSSHEQHQVDVGRGQTASKFKHGQAELSTVSRVSTSGEALKPNQLDDELNKNRPHPPDINHMMAFPAFATLPLLCIIVNTNRRSLGMRLTNVVISIPTGFAALLAQFPYRFRSIAWYNIGLGIGYIIFQISTFRGESKCHCENSCHKSKFSLPERSRIREMICSNMCLILVSFK